MLSELPLSMLMLMRENAYVHLQIIERVFNASEPEIHQTLLKKVCNINNLINDIDQCINRQKQLMNQE